MDAYELTIRLGANGGGCAPRRRRQPCPSKPTTCYVQSIISSVPISDTLDTAAQCAGCTTWCAEPFRDRTPGKTEPPELRAATRRKVHPQAEPREARARNQSRPSAPKRPPCGAIRGTVRLHAAIIASDQANKPMRRFYSALGCVVAQPALPDTRRYMASRKGIIRRQRTHPVCPRRTIRRSTAVISI